MKLGLPSKTHAFTLFELLIGFAVSSIVLAVTLSSAVALQRSFAAVDHYSSNHMHQIRIVDYLARDVRRGLAVTSSFDKQTVVVKIPKYIIQAGDADATSANIGTPRPPVRAVVNREINYGPPVGSKVITVEYSVAGTAITRSEDGVITTIASSTDSLVPNTIDITLADTVYATTAVKFKPLSVADRDGTVVYSTTFLRNRRRTF